MHPTPLCLSFSPSLLASTTRDLGTSDVICFMNSFAQPVMPSTVRSPWYLSRSASLLSEVLPSRRRKTMIVGKASILCCVQSVSDLSDVQSTLARMRRSSPGCVSTILAVAFSHTGSSFWHQWHHGVKKLTTTISCFFRSVSKVSAVSSIDLTSPSWGLSSVECFFFSRSLWGPSWRPLASRWIFLTRAAIPASWVPMKFVASTLAYSQDKCGKDRLKLI
jgi:hypothetical protein